MCMCVCMCVCARVRVRVCVYVCDRETETERERERERERETDRQTERERKRERGWVAPQSWRRHVDATNPGCHHALSLSLSLLSLSLSLSRSLARSHPTCAMRSRLESSWQSARGMPPCTQKIRSSMLAASGRVSKKELTTSHMMCPSGEFQVTKV